MPDSLPEHPDLGELRRAKELANARRGGCRKPGVDGALPQS